MAIKFDISKVYDKLEWNFLKVMMEKMGFDDRSISRIMTCVFTVYYSPNQWLTYDSLVFCKTNTTEWQEVQHLLDIYEADSGQGINKHKTSIFFDFNTTSALRSRTLALAVVSKCSN